ncbi:MAG: hypothetical protein J2P39_00210 [Candidatus Dormibacteraeota bacterium]|nr:hypothetical protein [Candidatus Dormibacteraeota bacterium]
MDYGRMETPAESAERHRESPVLTQVYERCREAFTVAEAASVQLQQAISRGRSDGPELEEFLTRLGTHRQWADLALWMAGAEVELGAQDLQRLIAKPPHGGHGIQAGPPSSR